MVDLSSSTFTPDSDIVEVFNDSIVNDTLVNTLSGDDLIKSSVQFGTELDFGIVNNASGIIKMGAGNDSLTGENTKILNQGTIYTGNGADFLKNIDNEGLIRTGKGNDSLNNIDNDGIVYTGSGDDSLNGVDNEGIIHTGSGNDLISDRGSFLTIPNIPQSFGMINEGIIRTNTGDDVIKMDRDSDTAIYNLDKIYMGWGNDSIDAAGYYSGIDNYGVINLGEGNDSLSAKGKFSGLLNNGKINLGSGNDILSGNSGGTGIENNGRIDLGSGNDLIETGRFSSKGSIYLGTGNDVISLSQFDISLVDGGADSDKAQFYFDSDEIEVEIISDNSLILKNSGSEGKFKNIELFEFKDFVFSFDDGSFNKVGKVVDIDFDEGDLAAGTIVTDQFEGINISTPSEFGVMIFDTNNPTGGDDDLHAYVGNALIISEDGNSSDPDDNAAGGTISVEFDEQTTVVSIGLLDIEDTGGSINLFADDSNLIEVIDIPALGDGELQSIDINVQNVASLDINLVGSGALTDLKYFESFASIDDGEISSTNNELM